MNKNRVIAGTMAVMMSAGSIGMTGVNAYAADQKNDTESKKEEVIYIMTDADGDVKNINAVNIFGKGKVTDYGDYSSVKMLNTTDKIKQNGDKVTFSSDKEKVYYQGTMNDTEIPWNIDITYTLDGKKITPEKLAGKSGALKMHITIDKNENCDSDFYDSSALMASLTLDTDNCENITADGATLANVGSSKQISYTVLPGKGLDAEITADVKDFEMDAVAINAVRMNLNVDIEDDELMDKVTQIMDAAKQLNDGAGTLSDGTDSLTDGGSSLSDGASSLADGINSLDAGLETLKNGVTDMQTALNTLDSQSSILTRGSKEVLTALQTIQSQLANVSVDASQLEQLTSSSAAIKQGITSAYNGAAALQSNLSYAGYKSAMKANGLDIDQLQSGNASAINTISEQISELNNSIAQLKSMPDYATNEVYQQQVAQMQSQISSLTQTVTLLKGNSAALGGTEQYLNSVSQGTGELVSGLSQLNTNYEAFDSAIGQLSNTLSGLSGNVTALKNGIDQLTANYTKLDKGVNAYTEDVAVITKAYSKINSGTVSLTNGSKKLVNGSKSLKNGTTELYQGLLTLNDGTKELKDGTQEFYDQTDGMDTKIEDTMNEMLDSLSGGDSETTSFVSEKNGNIDSVQFVIKTDAIEKKEKAKKTKEKTEETSVVEKFKNLFK